jgi:hypothetical protein
LESQLLGAKRQKGALFSFGIARFLWVLLLKVVIQQTVYVFRNRHALIKSQVSVCVQNVVMYAYREHCSPSKFGWKAVGVWTRLAAEDIERKHVAAPSDRVIVGVARGPELHGA